MTSRVLDPHANNHGVTNAFKINIYEPLVYRRAEGSVGPVAGDRMATRSIRPTWRFKLRPNVRFQGGEPFTA
jgi:peptide/nickel transport system substrate-binding protein